MRMCGCSRHERNVENREDKPNFLGDRYGSVVDYTIPDDEEYPQLFLP